MVRMFNDGVVYFSYILRELLLGFCILGKFFPNFSSNPSISNINCEFSHNPRRSCECNLFIYLPLRDAPI